VQRFTIAFNFLCVLLGLLHEGSHLSLSVRRKITVNVFYSTFTNVFLFLSRFTVFNVFLFLGNVFFIYGVVVGGATACSIISSQCSWTRSVAATGDKLGHDAR